MSENTLNPMDPAAPKAATSRIHLDEAVTAPPRVAPRIAVNPAVKPVTPVAPQVQPIAPTIRVAPAPAAPAAPAPASINLSAIPAAQTAVRPSEPAPAGDDIYKRRTALLDTSKIPLAATPVAPANPASAGAPRTIRVNRPTIRVGGGASGASFSPGRPEASAPAAPAAAEAAPKPTIKLKKPGGVTISANPSPAPSLSITPTDFSIDNSEDEVGGVWAVVAILGLLVGIGLVVLQVMTIQHAAY